MGGIRSELLIGVSAIILGLALPVVAFADPAAGTDMRQQYMSKMDTDKDGKISPSEWKAATDARFDKTDTNHDGFVTKDEMAAARAARAAKMQKMQKTQKTQTSRSDAMFARADTNGDGKLSKAEYEAGSQKMYERMMKKHGAPAGDSDGTSAPDKE